MKSYLYWLLCATLVFGCLAGFENGVCASEVAIVTLTGSGEVAFIDIENAKLIKTVQLNAPFPFRVTVTPDGKTAIVTSPFGQICFIDVTKMELIKCLKLLKGPEQIGTTLIPNDFGGVDVTRDGKTALVTEANELGQLFFIDLDTKEPSGPPLEIGDDITTVIVNSNGTQAYVLDIDNSSTYTVNLSDRTKSLFCGPPAGNDEVEDFVLTPDESHAIYIGSDNRIYLRDLNTCAIKETIEIDDGRFREPNQVALSPDGNVAIITNVTDQSVTFFSVDIGEQPHIIVEETIDVGGGPSGVAFAQGGQTAVVAVSDTNLLQIIDVASRQIKATIQDELGLAPIGVAIVEVEVQPLTAFVTRFYQLCLDRDPDPAGLEGWTNDLINKIKTGADVAKGFIFSQEFINKNTANEEYLTILYKAFFNRDPDQAGWDVWIAELNNGEERGYVLDGFLGSQEFIKLCEDYGIIPF